MIGKQICLLVSNILFVAEESYVVQASYSIYDEGMPETIERETKGLNPILYFDHQSDSTFTYDDFYNKTHLSEIGAKKFTEMLNRDINQSRPPCLTSQEDPSHKT